MLYKPEKQIEEIHYSLEELHDKYLIQLKNSDDQNDYAFSIFTFFNDFIAFKNKAFEEEKEIRIVSMLGKDVSNDHYKLKNLGYLPILYRIKNNIPVAYIKLPFITEEINPIKEVIIGPKNYAKEEDIKIFLETVNLENVIVKKSSASYI